MADRILTWYLEGIIGDGVEQGPVYYMDRDYMPVALRVMAKRVPDAGDLTLFIKDDGVNIMTRNARLVKNGSTEEAAEDFGEPPVKIAEGSLVSLDITSNGGKGITVQLELDEA